MDGAELLVHVDLGLRSYDIRIGNELPGGPGKCLLSLLNHSEARPLRLLLVTDSAVEKPHAVAVQQQLQSAGAETHLTVVPAGEKSKSWQQAGELYDVLVGMEADRRTVVVAVGGGVVGDLAGFVAATYARGLPFVQIPTTLLAMVDSSVGGKTGINHARGKNLIGAFHQPRAVVVDTSFLNTLPVREYRSGLAEVVKYGVILDAEFFDYLEQNAPELNNRDPDILQAVIARSCRLKADVVRQDEYETTGLRAVLNYGHTFAHAFEALAGYGSLLHGEAVSIGMICASRLAERLGRIPAVDTLRQQQLLQQLGLPVDVPQELRNRPEEIINCMLLDKKTESRELRFVLPTRLGHVEIVRGVSPEQALQYLDTQDT